jgi:hypothetical protein
MTDHAQTEAIRACLARLEDRHGRLTPQIVVDEAKKAKSPIHDEFDWNLERAAMQTWLERARDLIRSVRIDITTEVRDISSVKYIRDPGVESSEQGYVSIVKLRTQPQRAHDALVYEAARAVAVIERVRDLAVVFGLEDEAEKLLNQANAFRVHVEKKATEEVLTT